RYQRPLCPCCRCSKVGRRWNSVRETTSNRRRKQWRRQCCKCSRSQWCTTTWRTVCRRNAQAEESKRRSGHW
ncbi:hypothetical protein BGZ90_008972, partial [Linnemannia elongata]